AAALDEAAGEKLTLDSGALEYALRQRLEGFARDFDERPADLLRLETLRRAGELSRRFPLPGRPWRGQDVVWDVRGAGARGGGAAPSPHSGSSCRSRRARRPRTDQPAGCVSSPTSSRRRSIFAATMKSFSWRPPMACVHSVSATLFQWIVMSG